MCLPSKNNLCLDYILGRLQGWLQNSHATGLECQSCTPYALPTMDDIHDTLDGTVTLRFVDSSYPFLQYADPSLQPQLTPSCSWSHKNSGAHLRPYTHILASRLQVQNILPLRCTLRSRYTQASFTSCVDKARGLDSIIAKHTTMRAEVMALQDHIHSDTQTLWSQLRNMGSSMGPPGENSTSLNRILNRPQSELQKNCETGADRRGNKRHS